MSEPVLQIHLYECGHVAEKPCPEQCPVCALGTRAQAAESRAAELEAACAAREEAWTEALDYGSPRLGEVLTNPDDYDGEFTMQRAASLAQSVLCEDIRTAHDQVLNEHPNAGCAMSEKHGRYREVAVLAAKMLDLLERTKGCRCFGCACCGKETCAWVETIGRLNKALAALKERANA